MAIRQYWAGSSGPFLYDDAEQYEDGEFKEAARAKQAYIEDAPVHSWHVVNLAYLEQRLAAPTSEANSKVESAALNTSVARSVADSAALVASIANSKVDSHITP